MARTLLIVDDVVANREILKKILGDDYDFLEAGNGREAIDALMQHHQRISAVLLDLTMPVMDGFSVLKHTRTHALLSKIPIIIMTGDTDTDSEVKALSLGAIDYIPKPYNPAIIRRRIANTIALRETSATVNALQRDRLTGLYNREAFFDRIPAMLSAHAPGYYVMSSLDIDNFKVINDQYGSEEGDRILRHIGETAGREIEAAGGLCSRVSGDNFAALYPAEKAEGGGFAAMVQRSLSAFGNLRTLPSVSAGRYLVSDPSLSPGALYDRAYLAKRSVKGRYDARIAYYNEAMRDILVREQAITSEMDAALASRQFEVWFQPQYNHSTGALVGAEALVRWRHPVRGLIPPAEFIPVFEKNGFIYELDKFVWEETCRNLRKWLDGGLSPLPVSVNISRYDILRPDLLDVIVGFTRQYDIPVALLRLEITESAFAEAAGQVVEVVERLIRQGFTIEIDDFGSGYSSLNALKDVPAQVVKLDMRFLEGSDNAQRGGNILQSVVRMTKWLGMAVIAEGVETAEQANFLKSIGCTYVQGYLYAKPMPVSAYEELCRSASREEHLLGLETVDNMDNSAFWDPKSMDTLIFNSYVGSACVLEYTEEHLELLRVNDKFLQAFAGGKSAEFVYSQRLRELADPEGVDALVHTIRRAIKTGEEATVESRLTRFFGRTGTIDILATVRAIARAGDRHMLYCTVYDITAQREAERKERRLAKQLQALLDNLNCGITAVTERDGQVDYLLANDQYYALLGYTRAQYRQEIGHDAFMTLHPEDRQHIVDTVAEATVSGRRLTMEYRALRRDGTTVWLRSSISVTAFDGVEAPVQLCTYTDITIEREINRELLDNLPCGAALYVFDGRTITAVHLNRRYWELVGRPASDGARFSVMDAVHPDDRQAILDAVSSVAALGGDVSCRARIRYGESAYRTFRIDGRVVPRLRSGCAIYASYTPCD